MLSCRTLRRLLIVACLILASVPSAHANHGPGASGGGSATMSGETMKLGHYELTLREDYAQFEPFNFEQASARARRAGDFDSLNHGFITTADFSYGVTDDLQLGASIGYFIGSDFKSASLQPDGSVETSRTDPTGLTDAHFLAKYRVLKGQPGNLSIVAGVKAPTGRTDVRLDNSELLGATDQPGTGAWDFPIGLAYSRFLTSRITIDASVLYTFRTQHDHFKVGDRIDSGVAFAYRLTDKIKDFPQFAVFAELNDVQLMKDSFHGEHDSNSGSNTLYLTPGGRIRFNKNLALTVAPSFPIYEHVNGEQGKVQFKMAVSLSFSN
jgi:hypothetical protein